MNEASNSTSASVSDSDRDNSRSEIDDLPDSDSDSDNADSDSDNARSEIDDQVDSDSDSVIASTSATANFSNITRSELDNLRRVNPIINGEDTEDLNCSICMEVFCNPRVFRHCQHTFCQNCIKDHVNKTIHNGNLHVFCPMCRSKLEQTTAQLGGMPEDSWLQFFPKNIALSNVLSNLKSKGEYCISHKGKLYDHFCESHKVLCCSKCIVSFHRQCNAITDLDDLLKKDRRKDVSETLNIMIEKQCFEVLDKIHKSTQDEAGGMKLYLNNCRKKIHIEIDRLEKLVNTTAENSLSGREVRRQAILKMKEITLLTCKRIQTRQGLIDLMNHIGIVGTRLKSDDNSKMLHFSGLQTALKRNVQSIIDNAPYTLKQQIQESQNKRIRLEDEEEDW